ncbi:hypothetical protein RJ639_006105 [Escallonia herrerae]|uniref:Uncharacterized protein n=1 Tax=Escallonia herrerae TaxID=1293975 RepID=A0AA89ATI3_9ASTE|nr:hypothetical protein RJ639_006105 [Escallonia herrerae]
MDGVYEELDKVKLEMEKLQEDCRTKTELSVRLRKAHDEHLTNLEAARSQIEEQTQALTAKSGEISELKQLNEDLKLSVHEKELLLRHLNSANEKLRVDHSEKIHKLEGENQELALALDEMTTRNQGLESNLCANNQEIKVLKRLLSNTEQRCLEAEEKVQRHKELKQREDTMLKLEEDNMKVHDQLKWKNEQFEHLEEAHQRLRDLFRAGKVDWDREKSALLEEISNLQTSLDSQTRISDSLQTQLRMCNQALAHEESRRKFLEVEMDEFKMRFQNRTKAKIEHLTFNRDEEIAELRNSLGTKETHSKEMTFKITHLEQENHELRESLKEFQEAQINKSGTTTLLKNLQKKNWKLEQLQSKYSMDLKEKEVEWTSRMGKVTGDMSGYMAELKDKNKQIKKLEEELEGCHFLLDVQNEEISAVIMVLRSDFSAAYLKLLGGKTEVDSLNKEQEAKILFLTEQLEVKTSALDKLHANLAEKREKEAFSLEKVESFNHIDQQQILMEEELERQRKMVAEASQCQLLLKERLMQMENALKETNKDAADALEKAKTELATKICEVNHIKLDLQKWKSTAEILKKNQEDHKQSSESLLGVLKEQDEKIGTLKQQILLLESDIAAKTRASEAFEQEKENSLQLLEDRTSSITHLQYEIVLLKQESARRELEAASLARSDARVGSEQEKENLIQTAKEKDQRILDLLEYLTSLEQGVTNAAIWFIERQIEIDVLSEALEKAENMENVKFQEKNNIIAKLEMGLNDSHQNLKFQEESLFHLKHQLEKLKALLHEKTLEVDKGNKQFVSERMQLEGQVKALETQKKALGEDVTKLSLDREDLVIHVEEVLTRISEFYDKDVELMGILGNTMQNFEKDKGPEMNLVAGGLLYNSNSGISDMTFPPSKKRVEGSMTNDYH